MTQGRETGEPERGERPAKGEAERWARGLDEEQVEQVAAFFAAVLAQRLGEAGLNYGVGSDIAVRALVDFAAALRIRGEQRRLLLSRPHRVLVETSIAHGILAISDHDELIVPSFQFDDAGAPVQGVLEVNERLGAGADPWSACVWWYTPIADLGDLSPADLLQAGRIDQVRSELDAPSFSY